MAGDDDCLSAAKMAMKIKSRTPYNLTPRTPYNLTPHTPCSWIADHVFLVGVHAPLVTR